MNQSAPQLPDYPQSSFQDDEIDLKELFLTLWQGKITIVLCILVFSISAVAYALTAAEWWSSKAKVMAAQVQDFSEYQEQVKQFQSIFDIYQEDGTVLVSDSLTPLMDSELLFQQFINAYNSSNNKRIFLDGSAEFQALKALRNSKKEGTEQAFYSEWFKKINAVAINKKSEASPYTLSFQTTTKESSYRLLDKYIYLVSSVVFNDALNNLQAMVDGKRNELRQQKAVLEAQAKNRLSVEIERAQYALAIAKAAKVNKPIQNMGSNELFAIHIGAYALDAKISALKSIKNLTVIEPKLQQIDAKLDMLNSMKIDRNIKFQTFRYLENIEQPITRDKPKRALIVVLGALLGGMLGVAIVLVRFAFEKED
ncbi:LPS chain length-determining protein [Aliivibrio fischeri]|uniref:LPS O-antigen chain length determinant protein WzzB n=1 Tax=Aliivibrio fischeri TaxID=668 RepID=UPI0012D9B132|nr:Wzz/FepE/Etk N-terminal domain-containing protein [Aliivibrio fischeri]MUK39535.1 LPS chain length-determining protein [Aliivibrio fischeri]MUL04351.1 LPS chain length-determining protein [Aliivibrio fischeri]MUL07328.1 LPS chain length-determining protein [Aliivibrio fischeri]